VNFTVDATDADKDALQWTLDYGDSSTAAKGTALPATPAHTFAAAGNFSATFTVTDGKASANRTLAIKVAAGGAHEVYTFTNKFTGVDPDTSGVPFFGACPGGAQDVGGNWNTLNKVIDGWSYAVTPAGKGWVAWFVASDGSTYTGNGGETGTVPAASVEVDICTADPTSGGTYTFTATAP